MQRRRPANPLYSDLAALALAEARIRTGTEVLLVEYAPHPRTKLTRVVGDFDISESNDANPPMISHPRDLTTYQIIRDFIRSEFLKPVGRGTEYLHRISAAIAQCLRNQDAHGWLYPSALINGAEAANVAIVEEACEPQLKIKTMLRATMRSGDLTSGFELELKESGVFSADGALNWDDPPATEIHTGALD